MTTSAVYKGYAETFRFQLAAEQNWRCCYCGVTMNRFRNTPDLCTTEHVIPKAAGGQLRWEMCAAACKRCNMQRGRAILDMLRLPVNIRLCPRCGWLLRDYGRAWRCDECRTNFSRETSAEGLPFSDVRFGAVIRVAGDMLVSTTDLPWLANSLREQLRMGSCGKLVDAIVTLVRDPVKNASLAFPDDVVDAYRAMKATLLDRYALKTVTAPRGAVSRKPLSSSRPLAIRSSSGFDVQRKRILKISSRCPAEAPTAARNADHIR